jgi:competence protein ComEC
MIRSLFLSIVFIFTLSVQKKVNYYGPRPFKFNLSHKVKKSFQNKKNFYIYRSFITGRKRGVPKELKQAMTRLNLLHLLTPSGLHLSSLFIIFLILRRKITSKWITYSELIICVGIYIFLPGYFSLRRVALLRSLFLVNKSFNKTFTNLQIFLIFLVLDISFGTFQFSKLSFAYSVLFLGLIFLGKELNFLKLSLLFFSGQVMMAYISNQEISAFSVVFSPILTWIFTLFYPLTFINLIFIKLVNYSEWLVLAFSKLVLLLDRVAKTQMIEISWLLVLCSIIINRKTIYLCLGIISIHFLVY